MLTKNTTCVHTNSAGILDPLVALGQVVAMECLVPVAWNMFALHNTHIHNPTHLLCIPSLCWPTEAPVAGGNSVGQHPCSGAPLPVVCAQCVQIDTHLLCCTHRCPCPPDCTAAGKPEGGVLLTKNPTGVHTNSSHGILVDGLMVLVLSFPLP